MKLFSDIKELLIIIDMNNGFAHEGIMATPYMEALIPKIADFAKIFDDAQDKDVMIFNEAHSESSQEFVTFPVHCVKGTLEAQIVAELQWISQRCFVLEKNATFAYFSDDAVEFFRRIDKMANLEKVYISGGVTDICVLEAAIPLKKYFDQKDRTVEVVVRRDLVDTYDAPTHDRAEYNEIAFKLMKQAGINVK